MKILKGLFMRKMALFTIIALALSLSPAFAKSNGFHGIKGTEFSGIYANEEINGILADPAYCGPANFTGCSLPGYLQPMVWFQRDLGNMLITAQRNLQQSFGQSATVYLIIKDGYRPISASQAMREYANSKGRSDWIGRYISAGISLHNSGTAVDVTIGIATEKGIREIWMGSAFDEFTIYAATCNAGKRDPDLLNSKYSYRGLGYCIDPNFNICDLRAILKTAMANAGFAPYTEEWWHFTANGITAPALNIPIE